MRKFGLIGYPLGHSFSKKYFSEKFLREGITDASYENFPLQNINLFSDLILNGKDLAGLNVTIPYKTEIFRFLNFVSPEATEIGAVNVIKFRKSENGLILHGFNSDVTGIRDTISPFLSLSLQNAIVFGTGGSSKAVCFVLKKLEINIIQVSRYRKDGILSYEDISPSIIEKSRLIINTTPLGMYPETEGYPDIDYSLLTSGHILFDLVYNPEFTSFMKKGAERGCTVLSGLKMLHSQAEKAWEIWNSDDF